MRTSFKWTIWLSIFTFVLISCSKEEDEASSDPDYYFSINFKGNSYYFDNDILQYGHNGSHQMGGYVADEQLFVGNSAGLFIGSDRAIDSLDLKAELQGKRIYFNGPDGPYPSVYLAFNFVNWGTLYSRETPGNGDYYVEIREIDFLKNDRSIWDAEVWAVKGNYKAQMEDPDGGYTEATGDFHLQCSFINLD